MCALTLIDIDTQHFSGKLHLKCHVQCHHMINYPIGFPSLLFYCLLPLSQSHLALNADRDSVSIVLARLPFL